MNQPEERLTNQLHSPPSNTSSTHTEEDEGKQEEEDEGRQEEEEFEVDGTSQCIDLPITSTSESSSSSSQRPSATPLPPVVWSN